MNIIFETLKSKLGATPRPLNSGVHTPSAKLAEPALCSDLLEILRLFNSSVEFEQGANYISAGNEEYALETLYGLADDKYNLYDRNAALRDRLPKGYYTFGDSGEGDHFCICESSGGVFFWAHDAGANPLTFLCGGFSEFLLALTPDEDPSDTDLKKLKSIVKFEIDF
ncbi:SMI1/KNR4 family protein [Pseudomonas sp. NPDC089406]|uniref:SMI1/KNR4 family protein n=1 Tax=Pseudomonas sp. NPDC089406 TaxID=3364463 RepID=UPI00384D26AF